MLSSCWDKYVVGLNGSMFVTMQIVLSMFCGGKKRAGPRYLDNVICVNAGSAGEIP